MCVPHVHICEFMCPHMFVPIGHVFVFQVNTCLFSDERTCVCVFRVRIYIYKYVCVHVYTYVCSRVHTVVFQLDTRLCSRRPRVCYQMNTRVCLCFPRAHTCVCSHVQYTCVCSTCAHVCVFTCAHLRLPRVRICVFTCTHMRVPIGHVFVFQENTWLLSDEHTGVCSGCAYM